MSDNNDIFLKQMKGVKLIKKKNRIEKKTPNIIAIKSKKPKGKKITTVDLKPSIKLVEKTKEPEYILQNINIKKGIKKNFLKIEKKIDFHGRTLLESEELFSNTIIQCYEKNLRCILFITGKGLYKTDRGEENNQPKLYYGVIRNSFKKWIKLDKFSKYILSYEGAGIEHGGDGAFYVYLRKKKLDFY